MSLKAKPALRDVKEIADDKTSDVIADHKPQSTKCGCGKFTPDCLQPCATSGTLLACMCMFSLIETCVQWGLINVSLATWERRYNLKSSQSVWIITTQELIAGIFAPLFGYFALFWHKGRMLGAGAFCMVIANFLFLVPQFATGPYALGTSEAGGTCVPNDNSTYDPCVEDVGQDNLSLWMGVFILAQVLYGYIGPSIWTVGITYLDDNCKSENTVLYLGIFNAMAALGATLGFIGGGLSLGVYVDIGKIDMDTLKIDSSDPRWVGAWWIGFAVALLLSLPLLFIVPCFPRIMPGAVEMHKEKQSHVYKGVGTKEMERSDFGKSCGDLGHSLKVLLTNPVYMLITFGAIVEMGQVTAMAAFLPKVIQFQFGQTPSMAAFIAGAVLVPGAILGMLLGGIIPKVGKFNVTKTIFLQTGAAFMCIPFAFGFLAKCDLVPLVGFNTDHLYNSTTEYSDMFTHSCNDQCNCTTLVFEPICAADGLSYFSPCHGSCAAQEEMEDGTMMYGECLCISQNTTFEDSTFQAKEGLCTEECNQFWIFMPCFLILIILTFTENTPGQATIMRVVPVKQRSFAFGFQTPFYKLLGTIPIPILFGYVFDQSCDIWQEGCNERGSCWVYDTDALSVGLCISHVVVKTISGTCFLSAALLYKSPPPEEEIIEVMEVEHAQSHDAERIVTNGQVVGDCVKPDIGLGVDMGHVNTACDFDSFDYSIKL